MKIIKDTIQNIAIEIRTGKTPPTSNPEYFGEEVDWYTPSDLDKEKYLIKSRRGITQKAIIDKKAIIFKPHTVLIGAIGDIGKLGITSNFSSSNQQITGIYPNHEKLDTQYLYFWLKAHKNVLINKAKSAIVPILNNKDLGQIRISFPESLPDQLHIANILSKAENLIAQRKESIRLLDEFLKSTFLEMFGDPAQNDKNWEIICLGNLTINENSKRIPIKQSERDERGGKYPYYGASGIIDNINDFTHEGERLLIGEDGANLLFRSTPVAFIARERYWVNNHAHVLNNNSLSNLRFLEYYLNSIDLKKYITGSAQPKLNRAKLDSIPIFCPPINLQTEFAQIVEKTEALKAQYKQSLQELENLYGSLSQKAFRGELTMKTHE